MSSRKVQEYRGKAEEAEKLAAGVKDEQAKAIYRNIAGHWRELPDQTSSAAND